MPSPSQWSMVNGQWSMVSCQSMTPFLYWIPALAYAAVIFFLSHQSQPLGPEFPELVPHYALHFVEYGIFGWTLVWGLTSGFQRALTPLVAVGAWIMASLYGATDEFHQSFIPERDASFSDLLIDMMGAMIFVLFLYWIRKRNLPRTSILLVFSLSSWLWD